MSKATDKAKSLILQPHEVRQALKHGEVVVVVPVKPQPPEKLWAIWKRLPNQSGFPLGVKGTRVWVRERWCSYRVDTEAQVVEKAASRDAFFAAPSLEGLMSFAQLPTSAGEEKFLYAADFGEWADNPDADLQWIRAGWMPQRASRLTLTLSSVRVCQAQKVTEEEAMAAGFEQHLCAAEDTASCKPGTLERALAERLEGGYLTAKFAFQMHFNKQHPGAWDRNDWAFICHLTAAGNNQ